MQKKMRQMLAMLLAAMMCAGCALADEAENVQEEPLPAAVPVVEPEAVAVEEDVIPAPAEETLPEPEPAEIPESEPAEPEAEASKTETASPAETAEETVVEQPEGEKKQPWDDELYPESQFRGNLSKEKPALVLRLRIKKKARTLRFTTEKLAVKVTVTDSNDLVKKALTPIKVDKAYLPLDGTVELTRGEYLVTVEPAEEGVEGLFYLLATVVSEETAQAEETEEAVEPEAAAEEFFEATAEADGEPTEEPVEDAAPAETAGTPDAEEEIEELIVEVVEAVEDADAAPETAETTDTAEQTEPAEADNQPEPSEVTEAAETAEADGDSLVPEIAESSEPETAEEDVAEEPAVALTQAPEEELETVVEPQAVPTVMIESYVEEISQAGPSAVILLRVSVANADGPYTIQWQYTPDGGETVLDVPGATGTEYRYVLDSETAQYGWRVMVTMLPGEAE